MISKRYTTRFAFVWLAVAMVGCGGADAGPPDDDTSDVDDGKDDGKGNIDDGNSSGNGGDDDGSGGNGNGSNDANSNVDGGGNGDADGGGGGNPSGDDGMAGNGKDVVTIGDSYMRISDGTPLQMPGSEGIELSLEKVSKRDYRNYGYTGVEVFPTQKAAAVLNGVIPGQFENARKENPDIKTVVVAAGGNDLTNDCNGAMSPGEVNAACKKLLDDIEAACQKMVSDFAKAGVKDVVWVGYGKTEKASGGFPPQERALDGAIQILREKRMASCKADDPSLGGLRCHYVDSRALSFKLRDGFHPDAAGYDTIATAVWERMQKENVAR